MPEGPPKEPSLREGFRMTSAFAGEKAGVAHPVRTKL